MSESRVLQSRGNQITSPFMKNRKITFTSGPKAGQTVVKNHNGVDVVGTGCSLDYIVAHTAGTVKAAGYGSDVGYYANILTAPGVEMLYYHMAGGTLRVKTGRRVERGQVLGFMGATGNVTGAHLHFGIRVDGVYIDPEPYLNADFGGEEEEDMVRYNTVDQCPGWSRETIQKLVDRKALSGTGQGLDLSHDMVRLLVIQDKAGAFDKY